MKRPVCGEPAKEGRSIAWPICDPDGLEFVHTPYPNPPPWARAEPEIRAAWERMCAQNPRLFAGPVVSVRAFEPASGRFELAEATYRELVVQPGIPTGVHQLAVIAMVVDDEGRVLAGKRGKSVHRYPGLWEIGPAGGVDPPSEGTPTMAHILGELGRECEEEMGLSVDVSMAKAAAVVLDKDAFSFDIVFRVPMTAMRAREGSVWEYQRIGWLTPERCLRMAMADGRGMIGASLATLRCLGWLPG